MGVPVWVASVLLSALVAIGCGRGHPLVAPPPGAASAGSHGGAGAPGGEAGSAAVDPGEKDPAIDASASAPPEVGAAPGGAPEAGAAGPAPPPPAALPSCDELAVDGVPDALGRLVWAAQNLERKCDYYRCDDIVRLGAGCTLELDVTAYPMMMPTSYQIPPEECRKVRSWASNLRFLGVLRTGYGCEGGRRWETFSYYLDPYPIWGGSAERNTNFCPEPTIEAVRACLRDLVARVTGR